LKGDVQMKEVAKKSFILTKEANKSGRSDSDLRDYVRKIHAREEEKRRMATAKWYEKDFWVYLMKNNTDLYASTIFEMTMGICLYPLNTIKTRIQAQNRTEDVSHFQKNNVAKARKTTNLTTVII
jgi:hypothetical protein